MAEDTADDRDNHRHRRQRAAVDRRAVLHASGAGAGRRHRGPVHYNSLAGVRDMILHSTGEPLSVMHAQLGPFSQYGYENPVDNHIHMFCAPLDDPLIHDLELRGIRPEATASVIQHRMEGWKWQFLLTSEL